MSDRLPELRRQRALVAEHLAWLDREIAAEGGETSATPAAPLPPPAHFDDAADLPAADKILAEFRREAESSPARMRQGCIWSFMATMALLILGVAATYWLHYR
jgi:hypothetical protein